MRIGTGYDAHRLVRGRPLIVGGVEIPFEKGLDGHSDADVLVHAIIDALLGAAALGDIGKIFPDSDMSLLGASSVELLRKVGIELRANGFKIVNIDSTIIAQQPRMSPHIGSMCENIAGALGVDANLINVKATTEEGMGFTGNGLGVSAQAVCLIGSI